jgi:hypothetical protein
MKPEIGITEKYLHKSIALLETLLSDEMTLYVNEGPRKKYRDQRKKEAALLRNAEKL